MPPIATAAGGSERENADNGWAQVRMVLMVKNKECILPSRGEK